MSTVLGLEGVTEGTVDGKEGDSGDTGDTGGTDDTDGTDGVDWDLQSQCSPLDWQQPEEVEVEVEVEEEEEEEEEWLQPQGLVFE